MAEPTYIFEDGNVYTMVDGKVVSSVREADFDPAGHPIEGEVQMPNPPADVQEELNQEGSPCPTCGGPVNLGEEACPHCGSPIDGVPRDYSPSSDPINPNQPWAPSHDFPGPEGRISAHIVTTPNGLKGKVLARTPALWGEEVTVRFENGVIQKIPVDQRLTFAAAEETPEGQTAVERLDERLAATTETDKGSLLDRRKELQSIKAAAIAKVHEASDEEATELHRIVVQAGHEQLEVESALDAIQAAEPVEPFAPPASMPEVEQASMGGSKGDWLQMTHDEMVSEAAAQDFEKLMDEGPEAFVASLSDAQLADAGTTRVMAAREINSKLAGADENVREGYEKVWLGRVENKRREHLASRKEEVREKTASEETSAPDESLFM